MSFTPSTLTTPLLHELVHNPSDHSLQGLGFYGSTGFTDGRQRLPSPVLKSSEKGRDLFFLKAAGVQGYP